MCLTDSKAELKGQFLHLTIVDPFGKVLATKKHDENFIIQVRLS